MTISFLSRTTVAIVVLFFATALHAAEVLKSGEAEWALNATYAKYKSLQEGAIADISNTPGGNPYEVAPVK